MYIIIIINRNSKRSHADVVFVVPEMKMISNVAPRDNLVKIANN